MAVVMTSLGAAAVTAIYLIHGVYRDHLVKQLRRDGLLRRRVAFLLWKLAHSHASEPGFVVPPYSPDGELGSHRFLLL